MSQDILLASQVDAAKKAAIKEINAAMTSAINSITELSDVICKCGGNVVDITATLKLIDELTQKYDELMQKYDILVDNNNTTTSTVLKNTEALLNAISENDGDLNRMYNIIHNGLYQDFITDYSVETVDKIDIYTINIDANQKYIEIDTYIDDNAPIEFVLDDSNASYSISSNKIYEIPEGAVKVIVKCLSTYSFKARYCYDSVIPVFALKSDIPGTSTFAEDKLNNTNILFIVNTIDDRIISMLSEHHSMNVTIAQENDWENYNDEYDYVIYYKERDSIIDNDATENIIYNLPIRFPSASTGIVIDSFVDSDIESFVTELANNSYIELLDLNKVLRVNITEIFNKYFFSDKSLNSSGVNKVYKAIDTFLENLY